MLIYNNVVSGKGSKYSFNGTETLDQILVQYVWLFFNIHSWQKDLVAMSNMPRIQDSAKAFQVMRAEYSITIVATEKGDIRVLIHKYGYVTLKVSSPFK